MPQMDERAISARDVGRWLDSVGLGHYRSLFADQNIDLDVLKDLTDSDLEGLGISRGHRKRLLRGVAQIETGDAASVRAPGNAERRNLTVLFSDLVGSTALSNRLDPE